MTLVMQVGGLVGVANCEKRVLSSTDVKGFKASYTRFPHV